MAVSNEFVFYKAGCTQNKENCIYPHKVVVTNAQEFNEMAKFDHVCAEYRGNYRGNSNFIWANTLPADSDNEGAADSSEWITPEDIHQMFAGVPHIISKSKNNMKPKGSKPAVPRNHVFFAIAPETDQESYAALKKLLHKHYPFFDPKALDVGRYLDGAENPDAVFYPGTITLNEHLARLEAEEQKAANEDIDVIPEGSRNGTMFRFAVRTLKRYGNCEEAIKRFHLEADKCVPILEDSELNTIWNSALKYYGRIKQQADYISPEEYNQPKEFQWEHPIPFDSFNVPTFPVETLPTAIKEYVTAVAESTQTPVDLAALSAIAILSICLQGKYVVRPKADWQENLNTYCIAFMEPSERKSAVGTAMIKPINKYEANWNRTNAANIEFSKTKKNILERRLKSLEDQAAKGKVELSEVRRASDELAAFKEKKELQLYSDDVTTEKLVSILADNDGKAAIFSTEGGIFDMLKGIYTKYVNIDVFLKGYSGDAIRVERIGRKSENILNPTLSLMLMAQPSVLAGLMVNETFRGRGLTARFLYCMPKSNVGNRKYRSSTLTPEVYQNYERLIQNLLADEPTNAPEVITLSDEADKLLEQFAEELEPKLKTEYSDIADWAGKLVGNVARISGLLCRASVYRTEEFLKEPDPLVVSGEVMENAIRIGRYLIDHATAAFSLMGADDGIKKCKYVLDAILKSGLVEFTRRDVMRLCRSLKTVEQVQSVLDRLSDDGYIAAKDSAAPTGKGRPPNLVYLINPMLYIKDN